MMLTVKITRSDVLTSACRFQLRVADVRKQFRRDDHWKG